MFLEIGKNIVLYVTKCIDYASPQISTPYNSNKWAPRIITTPSNNRPPLPLNERPQISAPSNNRPSFKRPLE